MVNFISVIKFANLKKIPRQKVYRLIREYKLKEGVDYRRIKKTVERLEVREDLKI